MNNQEQIELELEKQQKNNNNQEQQISELDLYIEELENLQKTITERSKNHDVALMLKDINTINTLLAQPIREYEEESSKQAIQQIKDVVNNLQYAPNQIQNDEIATLLSGLYKSLNIDDNQLQTQLERNIENFEKVFKQITESQTQQEQNIKNFEEVLKQITESQPQQEQNTKQEAEFVKLENDMIKALKNLQLRQMLLLYNAQQDLYKKFSSATAVDLFKISDDKVRSKENTLRTAYSKQKYLITATDALLKNMPEQTIASELKKPYDRLNQEIQTEHDDNKNIMQAFNFLQHDTKNEANNNLPSTIFHRFDKLKIHALQGNEYEFIKILRNLSLKQIGSLMPEKFATFNITAPTGYAKYISDNYSQIQDIIKGRVLTNKRDADHFLNLIEKSVPKSSMPAVIQDAFKRVIEYRKNILGLHIQKLRLQILSSNPEINKKSWKENHHLVANFLQGEHSAEEQYAAKNYLLDAIARIASPPDYDVGCLALVLHDNVVYYADNHAVHENNVAKLLNENITKAFKGKVANLGDPSLYKYLAISEKAVTIEKYNSWQPNKQHQFYKSNNIDQICNQKLNTDRKYVQKLIEKFKQINPKLLSNLSYELVTAGDTKQHAELRIIQYLHEKNAKNFDTAVLYVAASKIPCKNCLDAIKIYNEHQNKNMIIKFGAHTSRETHLGLFDNGIVHFLNHTIINNNQESYKITTHGKTESLVLHNNKNGNDTINSNNILPDKTIQSIQQIQSKTNLDEISKSNKTLPPYEMYKTAKDIRNTLKINDPEPIKKVLSTTSTELISLKLIKQININTAIKNKLQEMLKPHDINQTLQ